MASRGFQILLAAGVLIGMNACAGVAPTPTATPAPTFPPTLTPVAQPAQLNVLCSPPKDWCEAIVAGFALVSGAQVTFTQRSSSEALTLIRADQANPVFDVWYGGPADAFVTAKNDNLLQPYVSPSAAPIPEALKDAAGNWTGVYVGVLGFCLNPERLAELEVAPPQTWAELLNPKLQGQIVMPHPATSGTAYTIVWTQATLNGGDLDKTFDYFKQLHPNIITYTRGSSGPGQLVGQGQVAVGLSFSHPCARVIEDGPPAMEIHFPTDGTGYEIGGLALLRGAPNKQTARGFIDWALSKEAQEIPAQAKYHLLPTNPQAAISAKAPRQVTLLNYDFIAAGAAHDQVVERFVTEIAPGPTE